MKRGWLPPSEKGTKKSAVIPTADSKNKLLKN